MIQKEVRHGGIKIGTTQSIITVTAHDIDKAFTDMEQ